MIWENRMGVLLLRLVHTVVRGLISRSAAAAVVSSFLFCRAHVRPPSDFDHTLEGTKMKGGRGEGGADEDYSFLFKGEWVGNGKHVSLFSSLAESINTSCIT